MRGLNKLYLRISVIHNKKDPRDFLSQSFLLKSADYIYADLFMMVWFTGFCMMTRVVRRGGSLNRIIRSLIVGAATAQHTQHQNNRKQYKYCTFHNLILSDFLSSV